MSVSAAALPFSLYIQGFIVGVHRSSLASDCFGFISDKVRQCLDWFIVVFLLSNFFFQFYCLPAYRCVLSSSALAAAPADARGSPGQWLCTWMRRST
jgi:hypothetical protein